MTGRSPPAISSGSIHQAQSGPNGSLHIAFFSSPNRMLDGSEDDLAPKKN
jgi:hypothetical protein